MAKQSRKHTEALAKVDRSRFYSPEEAITLAKETSYVRFDATVEAHVRLGIDVRHADQQVRSTVVLPAGTGRAVRVAVFAQGDKAAEALAAGADKVGADDLAKEIEGGTIDFDVAVATPDILPIRFKSTRSAVSTLRVGPASVATAVPASTRAPSAATGRRPTARASPVSSRPAPATTATPTRRPRPAASPSRSSRARSSTSAPARQIGRAHV